MSKTNIVLLAKSDRLNPTQRKSIGAGTYVKREREVNEALPPQINKMAGVFKSSDLAVRVGIARVS
jgi:hypothetical protein